ncbi:hypothetical protein BLNAU_11944 [Blattamonas nauphoetae]|uniref:Uncharacterized protein n=1 Tax=Blattamonas nauphoetae TaxID=2049346 RepID=A0ABQ9XL67_9EUKA|nr:hypothetical protein BLNAU_11944 [Blattamonas nauphoetae]
MGKSKSKGKRKDDDSSSEESSSASESSSSEDETQSESMSDEEAVKRQKCIGIAVIIINIVYAVLAVVIIVINAICQTNSKNYTYVPPLGIALGIAMILCVPIGIFGARFDRKTYRTRFVCLQVYLLLTLALGLVFILIGGYGIFYTKALSSKILMRWDYFLPDVFYYGEVDLTEETTYSVFLHITTYEESQLMGPIADILAGVALLLSPFFCWKLLGTVHFIETMQFVGSLILLIFGVATLIISFYLNGSYQSDDPTRLSLPSATASLIMMIVAAIVLTIVAIYGCVVSMRTKFSSGLALMTLFVQIISLAFIVAVVIIFLLQYINNLKKDIDSFLAANAPYVSDVHNVFMVASQSSLHMNDTSYCTFASVENCVDDEGKPVMTLEQATTKLTAAITWRVHGHFLMIGLAGGGAAVFQIILIASIVSFIIYHHRKKREKEDDY